MLVRHFKHHSPTPPKYVRLTVAANNSFHLKLLANVRNCWQRLREWNAPLVPIFAPKMRSRPHRLPTWFLTLLNIWRDTGKLSGNFAQQIFRMNLCCADWMSVFSSHYFTHRDAWHFDWWKAHNVSSLHLTAAMLHDKYWTGSCQCGKLLDLNSQHHSQTNRSLASLVLIKRTLHKTSNLLNYILHNIFLLENKQLLSYQSCH